MNTTLFSKYESAIRRFNSHLFLPDLVLASDAELTAYYAPVDVINSNAKIAIVGITPGKTQMRAALETARNELSRGTSPIECMKAAKEAAGFSGSLRPNLVSMMDRVRLNNALGLDSCAELFTSARALLQTTSILPFPVFRGGDDYRGTPNPLRHPMLRALVREHFEPIVHSLGSAIFIPVGDVPAAVLLELSACGLMDRDRVLDGLPHPSGANGERISYFLGKKSRSQLSIKTDPNKLDDAKAQLDIRVSKLRLQAIRPIRALSRSGANPEIGQLA